MYLYNTSTGKAFKPDAKMMRNIKVRSLLDDVSYLKRITLKEIKANNIPLAN